MTSTPLSAVDVTPSPPDSSGSRARRSIVVARDIRGFNVDGGASMTLSIFGAGAAFGSRHGDGAARVLALHGWSRSHDDFDAVLIAITPRSPIREVARRQAGARNAEQALAAERSVVLRVGPTERARVTDAAAP